MNEPARNPWSDPDPPEDDNSNKGCLWSGLVLLVVIGVVVVLVGMTGTDLQDDMGWGRLVYLIMLLVFIGAGLGGTFARNPGKSLRHAGIWVAIAAGLALLYSFEAEFTNIYDRVAGKASPTSLQQVDGGVAIRASRGGHFYLRADVEGESILFLVDTGATRVSLSHDAARRLGYRIEDLDFSSMVSTANGIGYSANITLDDMAVGPIRVTNILAGVNQADLDVSLLGMSFLSRLSGYEVRGDQLILYP